MIELEKAMWEGDRGGGSLSTVTTTGRMSYSCTGLHHREHTLIGERTKARMQKQVRDGIDVAEHGLVQSMLGENPRKTI